MRSQANIKSHPIHPMLVGFPIAFFLATVVSDIIFVATNNYFFYDVALYVTLLGIVFSLLAAIPGIIDFRKTVPPHSSAKKRAAQHGLLNITVVLIFCVTAYLRYATDI